MINQTEPKPYACYDFTTGGIAHHTLKLDFCQANETPDDMPIPIEIPQEQLQTTE
ncbi:MAG TPA: hypothetical protein VFQ23_21715 [Anaerolineales bacterium]|nr:hypothetical protein [Anaerolineales bacterium]